MTASVGAVVEAVLYVVALLCFVVLIVGLQRRGGDADDEKGPDADR